MAIKSGSQTQASLKKLARQFKKLEQETDTVKMMGNLSLLCLAISLVNFSEDALVSPKFTSPSLLMSTVEQNGKAFSSLLGFYLTSGSWKLTRAHITNTS